MTDADDAPQLAGLDIFLPSPPPDVERQEAFLDEAAALAVACQPITVYLQDEDGFARLIDDWGDRLLRLCTLYLGDVHLAEDAVQETLLKAWRNADRFRGGGSEMTWVTRIAINVCKSYLRSPWHRRRVPPQAMDTLSTPAPQAPDDTLPRTIMALPVKYREVVILYYYQEFKAYEIAQLLHISVSTVTVRLSRARKALREELKGWYYDEEE